MAVERIAIVGAGLAGLAAAVELKELGKHVELFERSRLLGGRATSFEVDGIEVDNGQHVFLTCCKEFMGFVERVGFEQNVRIQKRFEALVLARDGTRGRLRAKPMPPPLHLFPSFTAYPHLSVEGKVKIARALLSAMLGNVEGATTFEGWLVLHRQDAETRRAFWDPFFIPALNAPFDRVAIDDAMFTLRTAFLRNANNARFGYATKPLARLAEAAALRVDAVHRSTSVIAVDATLQDATIHLAGGDRRTFDAVVLAVPPPAAQSLLGDASAYGITGLETYEPYPILDVHLWHDGGPIGFDFAAALDSPLQWIFEKKTGYLSCSFSAASEYMGLPTADLEALAWREVREFVPELSKASLVRAAVTRNPKATWLPPVGTPRTKQQTTNRRLAIAGSWTDTGWPDTMESAIRSGYTAARLIGEAKNVVAINRTVILSEATPPTRHPERSEAPTRHPERSEATPPTRHPERSEAESKGAGQAHVV